MPELTENRPAQDELDELDEILHAGAVPWLFLYNLPHKPTFLPSRAELVFIRGGQKSHWRTPAQSYVVLGWYREIL